MTSAPLAPPAPPIAPAPPVVAQTPYPAYRYLPLITLVVLAIACALAHPGTATGGEIGQFISHPINTLYVATSAALLIIPSLVAARHQQVDPTWWWMLDFTAYEVLIGDGLFHSFLFTHGLEWSHKPGSVTMSGFPSGHATFAFGLAWLIYQRYPRLAPLWFALAVLIGWSRVEVHAHYTYQVLGGAIIGSFLAWLATVRTPVTIDRVRG
ncbi:MAG: phosphatase PAP2 family protein [Abitibacteriaceae bacterium]|nr:phosphatase PAP2 family protein [Abditibacteriaceae bacterium]